MTLRHRAGRGQLVTGANMCGKGCDFVRKKADAVVQVLPYDDRIKLAGNIDKESEQHRGETRKREVTDWERKNRL